MGLVRIVLLLLAMDIHLVSADKVPVSECEGFSYPTGCTKGVNCDYEASWIVSKPIPGTADPNGNPDRTATFNITIRRPTEKASHFYTAIGFSDHQAMPDTDVVIGYAWNNNFLNHVIDGYITAAGRSPPVVDSQQDVFNTEGSLTEDPVDRTKRILSFSFTRKLDTGDKKEDISLNECRYFFFMVSGGDVGGPGGNQFTKHDVTPIISSEKICLAKCSHGEGPNGAATITAYAWLCVIVPIVATLALL